MKNYRSLRLGVAMAVVAISIIGITNGCTQKTADGSNASGGSGPSGNVPVAKPGAQIGANNPPEGKPNHMSPEMQAQLQRYQSMGNGGGNAAPPRQ